MDVACWGRDYVIAKPICFSPFLSSTSHIKTAPPGLHAPDFSSQERVHCELGRVGPDALSHHHASHVSGNTLYDVASKFCWKGPFGIETVAHTHTHTHTPMHTHTHTEKDECSVGVTHIRGKMDNKRGVIAPTVVQQMPEYIATSDSQYRLGWFAWSWMIAISGNLGWNLCYVQKTYQERLRRCDTSRCRVFLARRVQMRRCYHVSQRWILRCESNPLWRFHMSTIRSPPAHKSLHLSNIDIQDVSKLNAES